jgi:hypothetical protein
VSRGLKEHNNEALRDLDLGYNEIKDDGACALAQVRAWGLGARPGAAARQGRCRWLAGRKSCRRWRREPF